MIVPYKNFLWWIIVYNCFNASLSQTKGIRNLFSDKFITKNDDSQGYIHESKNFLFYKSNVIYERSCNCVTEMSCSCCESVVLLFTKSLGQLCGNIMYRPEGLNVNITLDGHTIRSMTVTNYRPLKICALIPKSLFSIICFNIVELNLFPRSITACPRLEIATKNQSWKINYTCVSIATPMGSEVDSLIGNNSNRLTNSGTQNPLTILRNQTVSMQSVSPPKQTQSQFSAMTPGAINLSNSNKSITGITPETFKPSPTSSTMNFMQSSNPPVSLATSTSNLNTPPPKLSGTNSTSSVMISSRSLPYTATTKSINNKSSGTTETQTSFRNYPITSTTLTSLNFSKFTPFFEDTILINSPNLPDTTATMLATTKQSSTTSHTHMPLNYSSLINENTQDTSEIKNPLINFKITSITNSSSMGTHEIAESLNKTLTPIISIIPIIFPDNYSNLFFDDVNSNESNYFSTTPQPSSSSIKLIKFETTESLPENMSTTQITTDNDDQYSDDQTTQSTTFNSFIELLENTTLQDV